MLECRPLRNGSRPDFGTVRALVRVLVRHCSGTGSGTGESGNGYRDAFIFGVSGFDGFVPERVTKLSAVHRPRAVQPVSSNDQGLRNLIVNLLTLILVGGVLVILSPFHRFAIPVVVHPAFWLGLMGMFGFAVAPVPGRRSDRLGSRFTARLSFPATVIRQLGWLKSAIHRSDGKWSWPDCIWSPSRQPIRQAAVAIVGCLP